MLSVLAGFVVAATADPTIVVAEGLVIGQFAGGRWREGQKLDVSTSATITYRTVGLGQLGRSYTIKGFFTEDPPGGPLLGQPNDDRVIPADLLASGPGLRIPRKVKLLGTGSKVYVDAVSSFLASKRYKARARLSKVVSVDLDGNGTQEVLIEAASRPRVQQDQARPGDYSLVLLRALVGGKVRTFPIHFSFRGADQWVNSHEILGLADFEGDGKMEFVVTDNYYEGQAATLYRFANGKVQPLASNGAGV